MAILSKSKSQTFAFHISKIRGYAMFKLYVTMATKTSNRLECPEKKNFVFKAFFLITEKQMCIITQ